MCTNINYFFWQSCDQGTYTFGRPPMMFVNPGAVYGTLFGFVRYELSTDDFLHVVSKQYQYFIH